MDPSYKNRRRSKKKNKRRISFDGTEKTFHFDLVAVTLVMSLPRPPSKLTAVSHI